MKCSLSVRTTYCHHWARFFPEKLEMRRVLSLERSYLYTTDLFDALSPRLHEEVVGVAQYYLAAALLHLS